MAACTIHGVQYVIDCSTYQGRPSANRAGHGIFMHAIRQSCAAGGHNGEVMLAEASADARKGGKPIEPIA